MGLLTLLVLGGGAFFTFDRMAREDPPPDIPQPGETDIPESPEESFRPTPERTNSAPTGLTLLNAQNFFIAYPSGWVVQQLEVVPRGTSYLDTSIRRTIEDPNYLIRVDMNTLGGEGWSVDQTIEALRDKPGFQILERSEETFNSAGGVYAAETMEFLLLNTDTGVLMTCVDVFFVDEQGREFALLTRTPTSVYNDYEELLRRVRESIDPR